MAILLENETLLKAQYLYLYQLLNEKMGCKICNRCGTNFTLTRLMFEFFVNTCRTEPNEMFEALDISQIINLMFAHIILLVCDIFSSVVKVDG
jgi:hypothetical protein